MSLYRTINELKLNAFIYRYYIGGGLLTAWLVPQVPGAIKIQKLYIDPQANERKLLLKRESTYRNRSERLIDRFLVRAEKQQVEELKERLQQLEKVKNFKQNSKRQKLEQDEKNKKLNEEEKKELEERKQKYADVDHYNALCKIVKHMYHPKKFSKCLLMIQKLFKEFFDFFDGNTLFNTFDAIMRYEKKFEIKEDREIVEQLYFQFVEYSEQDEDLFSEEQESIIDLYYVPVYMQSNLYTDDSFKFNGVVKEVNEMLESLSLYHKDQDKYNELCVSKEKIQELFIEKTKEQKQEEGFRSLSKFIYDKVLEESDEEQFVHFMNGIKRRMFFSTLKQIFDFSKYTWAKVSVNQTIKKVYLEKEKFSEEEQEQLEDMISAMKNLSSMGISKISFSLIANIESIQNRERLDDKIKTNPLESAHQVKDGRDERIVIGESSKNKWASKQMGLTWSDSR